MADVTDAPVPIGSDEFDIPGDFKKLADHFGDDDMFSRPNPAALPSSGNWPGRMLMTEDTGVVYQWKGSAWVPIAGGPTGAITGGSNVDWSGVDLAREGRRVFTDGRVTKTTGTFGTTEAIGTVPAGFRPLEDQLIDTVFFTTGFAAFWGVLRVNATGLVYANFNGVASIVHMDLRGKSWPVV